jgi:hypothetical protein
MSSDSLWRHSSSTLRYPEWQRPFQDALLEVDPKKLDKCVEDAETAIYERLEELCEMSESRDGETEREVIASAICALKVIKRGL